MLSNSIVFLPLSLPIWETIVWLVEYDESLQQEICGIWLSSSLAYKLSMNDNQVKKKKTAFQMGPCVSGKNPVCRQKVSL